MNGPDRPDQPKYANLYALLEGQKQAQNFYESLPDYVQDQISQRADHINSVDSLMNYAENLLRGDD